MRLLTILIFISSYSFSQQTDVPFNQLADKGKKQGYWKVFLDSNGNQTIDSANAAWYYYKLYNYGSVVYGIPKTTIRENKIDEFKIIRKPKIFETPTPINDTLFIRWKLKEPNDYIYIFKNGYLKEEHRIFEQDGTNWHILNYSIKYNENPYSYFVRIINSWSNKKINEGYYYFENGKRKKDFSVIEVETNNYYQNNKFE